MKDNMLEAISTLEQIELVDYIQYQENGVNVVFSINDNWFKLLLI